MENSLLIGTRNYRWIVEARRVAITAAESSSLGIVTNFKGATRDLAITNEIRITVLVSKRR